MKISRNKEVTFSKISDKIHWYFLVFVVFSFLKKKRNMKVSSYSHRNTYFDFRHRDLGLFRYLVFYLNEKSC